MPCLLGPSASLLGLLVITQRCQPALQGCFSHPLDRPVTALLLTLPQAGSGCSVRSRPHQVVLLRGQKAAQDFAVGLLPELTQALQHIAIRSHGDTPVVPPASLLGFAQGPARQPHVVIAVPLTGRSHKVRLVQAQGEGEAAVIMCKACRALTPQWQRTLATALLMSSRETP